MQQAAAALLRDGLGRLVAVACCAAHANVLAHVAHAVRLKRIGNRRTYLLRRSWTGVPAAAAASSRVTSDTTGEDLGKGMNAPGPDGSHAEQGADMQGDREADRDSDGGEGGRTHGAGPVGAASPGAGPRSSASGRGAVLAAW